VKPASDERTPDGGAIARPDREQLMSVRSADHDGAVVLTVTGEIDGLTAARLRVALGEAFDGLDGRPLIVDLSQVQFLGSPGLRTLRDSAEEAVHQRGCQTLRVVVDEARPVIRPIEITGLDQILALYHTVEHALAGGDLRP
jgi:anti-sigma B factor antagonist